jgi:hypothetical protein
VSATRFTYARHVDLLGVFWHGFRLRSRWEGFAGSVGVSITSDFAGRSTYTVSVWRSEADLKAFIVHPRHRVLMQRYRPLLESSQAVTWTAPDFSLSECWLIAKQRLARIP